MLVSARGSFGLTADQDENASSGGGGGRDGPIRGGRAVPCGGAKIDTSVCVLPQLVHTVNCFLFAFSCNGVYVCIVLMRVFKSNVPFCVGTRRARVGVANRPVKGLFVGGRVGASPQQHGNPVLLPGCFVCALIAQDSCRHSFFRKDFL